MPPLSRLGRQLQEVLAGLDRIGAAITRPPIALAAEGGAPATATVASRDPYEALDDLMAVVEALCPSWPERPGFGPMRDLRL